MNNYLFYQCLVPTSYSFFNRCYLSLVSSLTSTTSRWQNWLPLAEFPLNYVVRHPQQLTEEFLFRDIQHSLLVICSPREREHKKHISIKLLFYGFSPNKIWNHGALFFYIYLPVIKREAQLWMFSPGSWSCQIQRKIAKVSFATKHGASLFECRVFYLLYWFG